MVDRLTQDCIAARKAGMSYGKWKVLHPHTEVEIPQEKEQKPGVPKRKCKHCGKEVYEPYGRRRTYCDRYCYYEAMKKRQKEKRRMESERRMENGKI